MRRLSVICLILFTSSSFAEPKTFTVNSLDEKVSIPHDLPVINRPNGEIVVTDPRVLIDGEEMYVNVMPYQCMGLGCRMSLAEGILLICESLEKTRAKEIKSLPKVGVGVAEFDDSRALVNVIRGYANAATKFTCY